MSKLNGFLCLLKTCFISTVFLLGWDLGVAQSFDIEEKCPVNENGLEYGFIIKNEQLKTSGGEEYSRYEVTLYISNKSGCTKIYSERNNSYFYESPNLLATFNCRNANGKRFTSKGGTINARDFYIPVKHKINNKDTTENLKAGYIFRNGETLKNNIIILVPKNERPKIACIINDLPEPQ